MGEILLIFVLGVVAGKLSMILTKSLMGVVEGSWRDIMWRRMFARQNVPNGREIKN